MQNLKKNQNELSNMKAYLELVCYLMHTMNYVRAQQVDAEPQFRRQGTGAHLATDLLLLKDITQEQHHTTEANAENEC